MLRESPYRSLPQAMVVLLMLCLATLATGGCGASADAEPLEVTYYYLPG